MRASTCERLVIATGSAQPPTRHPQDRAARRRVRQRSEADDRRRATGAWVTMRGMTPSDPAPTPDGFGRLEPVELRSCWADEARNLTPWIAGEPGLALLGKALDMELSCENCEVPVGLWERRSSMQRASRARPRRSIRSTWSAGATGCWARSSIFRRTRWGIPWPSRPIERRFCSQDCRASAPI